MTTIEIPVRSAFGLDNLPYGVFELPGAAPRVGIRVGDSVLDLAMLLDDETFAAPALNTFMAQGRARWTQVREQVSALVAAGAVPVAAVHPVADVALRLPFEVSDYVDFYASEHHAANLGRLFRPDAPPLMPNWKYLPVGYHGRAGTVVVSGTPVVRPCGQRKGPGDPVPVYGPCRELDIEAEVGFVVGAGSTAGLPVSPDAIDDHVFGLVLVNDWSARDIQRWETVPLGPFLAKSFATSVSPWVVPLDALAHARVAPPAQDPPPLPYLRAREPWGLDLAIEVECNGDVVARPPFAGMYWTPGQQLAHMTVNGASLRTGDLFASGTVSGPERGQRGCFLELSWGGTEPVTLSDGSSRTFLQDGDTVTIRASAPGADGTRIGFGDVTGTIKPAVAA